MEFKKLVEKLEKAVENSYVEGITVDDAEKLASEFLRALFSVSTEIRKVDLDARMRKAGVKAVRAAIYLDIVQKSDKKPTEAQIGATIDSDKLVLDEQAALDTAEVDRDELERYHDIFTNGHVHFRTIAKGRFD